MAFLSKSRQFKTFSISIGFVETLPHLRIGMRHVANGSERNEQQRNALMVINNPNRFLLIISALLRISLCALCRFEVTHSFTFACVGCRCVCAIYLQFFFHGGPLSSGDSWQLLGNKCKASKSALLCKPITDSVLSEH